MNEDLKAKLDETCRTAEDFTKLFYDSVDKRRHLISRLYVDNANLLWNGNGVEGKENIAIFWSELPASEHTVESVDAQPVMALTVAGKLSFMIKATGQVKYQDKNIVKPFTQIFLITLMNEKWKIVHDCFRTREPLDA